MARKDALLNLRAILIRRRDGLRDLELPNHHGGADGGDRLDGEDRGDMQVGTRDDDDPVHAAAVHPDGRHPGRPRHPARERRVDALGLEEDQPRVRE